MNIQFVALADLQDYARDLLAQQDIAFVDVCSASNNCYHCRIVRAG